jgi:molybdopterin synthase catalytic subunit
MFRLVEQAIPLDSQLNNPHIGGVVIFEGRVRSINEGKKVNSLEYEVYQLLAQKEGDKIIQETLDKFDILDLKVNHRVGHLQIGDIALYAFAGSVHRSEAFEATQYVVDQIKLRVPIWKKEHYADGTADWVACHRCAEPHAHNGHAHAS